ncbi:MAG: hypothetical protein WCP10_12860 [Desulfuromonadales bacterium]
MQALDTDTVILSLSALNILVGATFLAFHERGNAIRLHLCGAMICFGVAGLLIGFRAQLPPWFANVFANMLVGVSVVLIHRCALLIAGKPPTDRVYLVSVLALGAVYYLFTYPMPHTGIRLFSVSLFRVPFFIGAALALRSANRFQMMQGARALIWLLCAGALWYLVRGSFAIASEGLAVLFRTGIMQSMNFFIAAVTNILIALAFSRVDAEQALNERDAAVVELRNLNEDWTIRSPGGQLSSILKTENSKKRLPVSVSSKVLSRSACTAKKSGMNRTAGIMWKLILRNIPKPCSATVCAPIVKRNS